jgi:putative acetyltransferase
MRCGAAVMSEPRWSPRMMARSSATALALALMAVLLEVQNQGGSALVRRGLVVSREKGHRIVVVLGHAHFDQRFRFAPKRAAHLDSPLAGR